MNSYPTIEKIAAGKFAHGLETWFIPALEAECIDVLARLSEEPADENAHQALPARILPNIDALLEIFKDRGEELGTLIAEVRVLIGTFQSISSRFSMMTELKMYIQPQGPIEITVPLKTELPR